MALCQHSVRLPDFMRACIRLDAKHVVQRAWHADGECLKSSVTSGGHTHTDDDDDDDDDDNDDDDNDDEDDYSRFRVFGHNSPKNNFLALKPKNELFLCKNTTFLLNKFFSRMKLKFWLFLMVMMILVIIMKMNII